MPGVGEKTATKLIQTYGSIENLYAQLDTLEPKLRDKVAAAKEQLLRSKRLVTIVTACGTPASAGAAAHEAATTMQSAFR